MYDNLQKYKFAAQPHPKKVLFTTGPQNVNILCHTTRINSQLHHYWFTPSSTLPQVNLQMDGKDVGLGKVLE